MKRFNLISILILFFTFFGVQCVMADETREANQPNSSSPYYTTLNNTNKYNVYSNKLNINLYYPSEKVIWLTTTNYFFGWCQGRVTLQENKTDKSTTTIKGENISTTNNISPTTNNISFYYKEIEWGDAATTIDIHDVKIYIAPHIRLLNKTENNVTYTSIDENTVTSATATLDFGKRNVTSATTFEIDFKSFLAQTNKKFKVTLSGSDDFYFTKDKTLKQFEITETFCKLNTTTGNFSITYSPQSEGASAETTITITDGTSTATITLTGEGQKIDQDLKWTANMPDQMILGESIATNGLATSNCPTAITYSPSDPTIITVTENGYLVAKQPGTTTITATNTGNNQYNEKSITKEVTVTSKSLQQIVWNQSFTLLKLGDPAQTLTATVIDVTTGETIEGAQITFTSNDPNVVSINGTTLTIAGLGNTTIVAETPETETHATARTIKSVYVREAKATCEGEYIINETEPITKTTQNTLSSVTIEETLTIPNDKIGSKLTFTLLGNLESITVKDNTNNKNISLTQVDGKYEGKIDKNTKSITIKAQSETYVWPGSKKTLTLSEIIVHPAIYLETQTKEIVYEETKMGSNRTKYISFDYANQPDAIWGMIVDDENTEGDHSSNFTFENSELTNFTSWGEGCGDINTKQLSIKFTPTQESTCKAKLLVGVGENGKIEHTILLSATATKINHTIQWQNTDNEVELNSIFICNAIVTDNEKENPHIVKYSCDEEFFTVSEQYPGYLYAKKTTETTETGTTTVTAYIEATDYCAYTEATFEVKILPEKATMTWAQDLSNFVEAESAQTVTLNATSNKEGEIVYEIVSNNNNIISLNGDQLTIAANVTGSAEIKAYNQNYPDVFVIKNVIVASIQPCKIEIDHGVNLKTDYYSNEEKSITINLDKKCKSVSFTTDLTGDGANGDSYGTITITDNNGNTILNEKRFYDDGISESYDIDINATKLTLTIKTTSLVEVIPMQSTLTNVKTVLASDFNNYTTDKDTIDFGIFTVGVSSVSKDLKINYWSLPGHINLSIESGNATRAASPFSVTPTTLSENCGIGEKTVTVTLNPNMGGTFEDYLVIKTGGDKVVRKIPLTAIINKADQTITWTDKSLTTADRQVSIATASSNLAMNYEIVSGGEFARVENNVLGLAAISVVDAGTFKVKAYSEGNESYNAVESEKEFTSTIGTIVFDNNKGDNNWNDAENWLPVSDLNKSRNVAPSAVVNAEIRAEAVISSNANNTRNEIHNILFAEGGKLTIGAGYGLEANSVEGATAENLTLESSADGNAAFTFLSGTRTPSATVKMYSKANQENKPQWQYMGVAVNGATTNDFDGAWLLKWTESENVTGDPWSDAPLEEDITLVPWAGYSISQPTDTTYTMKGELMNGDHKYELTRTINENATTQDPDCGFNLLANSYTAPIDITKLTESNFVNADACIVLYNTGTYADWETKTGQTGEAPGQLTVVPVETGQTAGLTTTIASMQAFFVMAQEDGATFTVDYETAVAGATNTGNQMRAPKADREFNVLKIMIEGENTRDRLWLLENEKTTRAYDNGYEARKIFDAPRGHQMYATCQYGYASIDCSESMVGQTIGLKGDNEGELLTISFDTSKLKYYQSLYLYDKATGKYVNITAGEEYTFYGVKGADDNRFSIVTNPDDEMQTPPFVVIDNTLCFDKSQIDTDNANIYIYDTSGRLLMTEKVNPYESYNIPDMPNGIYLVSIN